MNGIGEASHADFGITGAKNEGLIFAHGEPLRKVPQERLVEELFAEIDSSLELGRVDKDEQKAAEGAEWLQKIEEENADELTPERIAALEAGQELPMARGGGRKAPTQGAPRRGRLADGRAPLHARLASGGLRPRPCGGRP